MMRPRVVLAAAGLVYGLALALVATVDTRVIAAPVAAASKRAQASQLAKPQTPPADYVGNDTCLGCHDDAAKHLASTLHWKNANPRSPAAQRGCESCHGPGSRHVEDPGDDSTIRKFTKMAPREVNATCLTCHAKATHALWEGSTHDARNLS